ATPVCPIKDLEMSSESLPCSSSARRMSVFLATLYWTPAFRSSTRSFVDCSTVMPWKSVKYIPDALPITSESSRTDSAFSSRVIDSLRELIGEDLFDIPGDLPAFDAK